MIRLLAVDPGVTTGYATFDDDGECRSSGSFPLWQGLPALFVTPPAEAVCERFALYAAKAPALTHSEFPTVQVIGVLRYLAELAHVPLYFQPASCIHRQGRITPLLLPLVEAVGVKGSHARDAAAHGLWYLHFGIGRGREGGRSGRTC